MPCNKKGVAPNVANTNIRTAWAGSVIHPATWKARNSPAQRYNFHACFIFSSVCAALPLIRARIRTRQSETKQQFRKAKIFSTYQTPKLFFLCWLCFLSLSSIIWRTRPHLWQIDISVESSNFKDTELFMCLQVAITHNLLIGFIIIVLKTRRAPMPLRQGGRLWVAYLLVFVASVLLNNPLRLLAFPGFADL